MNCLVKKLNVSIDAKLPKFKEYAFYLSEALDGNESLNGNVDKNVPCIHTDWITNAGYKYFVFSTTSVRPDYTVMYRIMVKSSLDQAIAVDVSQGWQPANKVNNLVLNVNDYKYIKINAFLGTTDGQLVSVKPDGYKKEDYFADGMFGFKKCGSLSLISSFDASTWSSSNYYTLASNIKNGHAYLIDWEGVPDDTSTGLYILSSVPCIGTSSYKEEVISSTLMPFGFVAKTDGVGIGGWLGTREGTMKLYSIE